MINSGGSYSEEIGSYFISSSIKKPRRALRVMRGIKTEGGGSLTTLLNEPVSLGI